MFGIGIITVTIVIDPYGELNFVKTKFNNKKFASNYTTGPFLLSEKLKTDKYSLIFGTSRTQLVNSSMIHGDLLNYSTSLYANPSDVYNVLRQFNEIQLRNINTIYYLVDTHVFTDKKSLYEKLNLHSNIDFYRQVFSGLNMKKIHYAISCVRRNLGRYDNYLNEFGENIYLRHKIFNPKSKIDHFRIPSFTKSSIEYLQKIDSFCKKENIKIKYFTPVYNIWYLKKVDLELYRLQFKAFLTVIDKIYDFHLIDDISYDYNNFTGTDHYNTITTAKVMSILESNESSIIINEENIDEKFDTMAIKIREHNGY